MFPKVSRSLPLPRCTVIYLIRSLLFPENVKGAIRAFQGGLCALFSTAYLQIGELAKGLGANVAFVLDLPILLLQWVWEGFVTSHIPLTFNEIHGFFTAGGGQHH